ncbi:MAG: alpha/beta hydrolase, partial [Bacteroidales bacterium]|nr:alpha/beta hydrolase [Bacteroidales bacterium]
RVYGEKPYKVVVVHGGPGAPGSLGSVARELSRKHSILEPFQSERSVNGQVDELHKYICENCEHGKIKIIGHSWGAWLAYMYAALHPERVEKLILVAAGSFDERYNFNLTQLRLSRLDEESRKEALEIINWMNRATTDDTSRMIRFSELMEKADFYDCDHTEEEGDFQYDIFNRFGKKLIVCGVSEN